MFVGHYGVSFAVKRRDPTLPLWVLFLAVQLLDMRAQLVRSTPTMVFGVVMLAIQAYVFFGPPPASAHAAALTALVSYAVFAVVIHVLERKRNFGAATAGRAHR